MCDASSKSIPLELLQAGRFRGLEEVHEWSIFLLIMLLYHSHVTKGGQKATVRIKNGSTCG